MRGAPPLYSPNSVDGGSRKLGSLATSPGRRLLVVLLLPRLGFRASRRKADYAAVLAPNLEVESIIVVVDESFGEKPLVVVKSLGPLRDGFVFYLAGLLTHLHVLLPRKKPAGGSSSSISRSRLHYWLRSPKCPTISDELHSRYIYSVISLRRGLYSQARCLQPFPIPSHIYSIHPLKCLEGAPAFLVRAMPRSYAPCPLWSRGGASSS
jgi:hypothetical protein